MGTAEPEFREAVLRVKSSALEAMRVHEKACADPDADGKCRKERVNVVAFIAHALEMKPAQLVSAAKVLARYNEEHDAGLHEHGE